MKGIWLLIAANVQAFTLGLLAEHPRFNLPVQYYQIARLYGPGMEPTGKEGLHQTVLKKTTGKVGLVLVHTWNLGEEDGPYPIGPDAHCPGEAADWVPTAREITANHIRPVLKAARSAGIEVFHLAQHVYADRYPQYRAIKDDPELQAPDAVRVEGSVAPRSVEEMWETEYGDRFPGPVWLTHADRFDIAKSLRPLPDEAVILNGWQLNGLCRKKGIDTLVYAGFMADLCLVNIPGAIREMAHKFKYRCVVLRDCTTAYEFADTEGKWMTFAAIRLIESGLGYSASGPDFVRACEGARGGAK